MSTIIALLFLKIHSSLIHINEPCWINCICSMNWGTINLRGNIILFLGSSGMSFLFYIYILVNWLSFCDLRSMSFWSCFCLSLYIKLFLMSKIEQDSDEHYLNKLLWDLSNMSFIKQCFTEIWCICAKALKLRKCFEKHCIY